MTMLILGSRVYAPLSDVEDELMTVAVPAFSFGTSDVAVRAEQFGARRKPLETTRTTLLEMAAEPGAEIVLFVARDSVTKQPTQGMAGIQNLLTMKDVPFRIVSSPFPGSICDMVTNLRHAVDKTCASIRGARRDNAMAKALGYSSVVTDKRNEYLEKLEAGKNFEVGNAELDERYVRWIHIYTELEDSLRDAGRMLRLAAA